MLSATSLIELELLTKFRNVSKWQKMVAGKTKGPTGTLTPTRRCKKRTGKINQIRTPGENEGR